MTSGGFPLDLSRRDEDIAKTDRRREVPLVTGYRDIIDRLRSALKANRFGFAGWSAA
jgi:hypothetical protein